MAIRFLWLSLVVDIIRAETNQFQVWSLVAQGIMRHSDINLIMNTYTHVLKGRVSEAVAARPDLSISNEKTKKATGAYDVAPDENLVQILSKSGGKQRISADFD